MNDNQLKWLTLVVTILGSALGLDVRQGDRVEVVKQDVSAVSAQNKEILQGIAQLLDSRLATTVTKATHNERMNTEITELSKLNKELNTAILERIEKLEKKLSEGKR